MRTNIDLDEALVAEALDLTGAPSKREVVDLALRELVRSRQRRSLLDLAGVISLQPDFDHKALRRTRRDHG